MTFWASAHICLCGLVLGANVLSRSGESADFGSISVAESDCVARSGEILRKPFNVRGYMKCGTGIQEPRMCVLRTIVDFFDHRVL